MTILHHYTVIFIHTFFLICTYYNEMIIYLSYYVYFHELIFTEAVMAVLIYIALKKYIITCLWCSYSGSCLALTVILYWRLAQPILKARLANCDKASSFCSVSISFVNDSYALLINYSWLDEYGFISLPYGWFYSFGSYTAGCIQIKCTHIDAVAVPNGNWH